MTTRRWADDPPRTKRKGTTKYTVAGMTCGHCVSAVTEEVTKIAGVADVQVDLASGAVSVASASPLDDSAVKEAVEEAGYELVAN